MCTLDVSVVDRFYANEVGEKASYFVLRKQIVPNLRVLVSFSKWWLVAVSCSVTMSYNSVLQFIQ